MSERYLSMRAPSVAPRGADAVGSLKVCRGGTAVGETREEGGGKLYFFIINSKLIKETHRALCAAGERVCVRTRLYLLYILCII